MRRAPSAANLAMQGLHDEAPEWSAVPGKDIGPVSALSLGQEVPSKPQTGYVAQIYKDANDRMVQYKGMLEEGKKHGNGCLSLVQNDDLIFNGMWEDDVALTGYGRIADEYGVAEGPVRNGFVCGQGVWWLKNGRSYEGEMYQNRPHGHGSLYDARSHLIASGTFVDGQMTGLCNVYHQDGSTYNGQLKYEEGVVLYNGNGTYTWKDGSTYQGQWLNGKRHGQGEAHWPVGTYGKLRISKRHSMRGRWHRDKYVAGGTPLPPMDA